MRSLLAILIWVIAMPASAGIFDDAREEFCLMTAKVVYQVVDSGAKATHAEVVAAAKGLDLPETQKSQLVQAVMRAMSLPKNTDPQTAAADQMHGCMLTGA